jgi:hypothetical protein
MGCWNFIESIVFFVFMNLRAFADSLVKDRSKHKDLLEYVANFLGEICQFPLQQNSILNYI